MTMERRQLFSLGGAAAAGILASAPLPVRAQAGRTISASEFGIAGDGRTDDTRGLQRALDAAFERQAVLLLPPGDYRVRKTLKIEPRGHVTRQCGIIGQGARLISEIEDGANVIEVVSRSTFRFLLIQGLDIKGSGRDGHGILLACRVPGGEYLYNFCLRDIVVQGCGGDGCHMVGNVFEGQVINCYFRGNGGNGTTFAHSENKGILSAVHVFASVFGQNGKHGVALLNNCYDVSFHGCYFLLNQQFGVLADNGCTLLSNCGFENNHQGAPDFSRGDAGIYLKNFGTLIGCTAYSIYKQTHLLRAFIVRELVMVGCSGHGGGAAKGAGLARLRGARDKANVTLVGCMGRVTEEDGVEAIEIGGGEGGLRLGSDWRSRNLPRLGNYRLWVDRNGQLRIKKGAPQSDDDGRPVGI